MGLGMRNVSGYGRLARLLPALGLASNDRIKASREGLDGGLPNGTRTPHDLTGVLRLTPILVSNDDKIKRLSKEMPHEVFTYGVLRSAIITWGWMGMKLGGISLPKGDLLLGIVSYLSVSLKEVMGGLSDSIPNDGPCAMGYPIPRRSSHRFMQRVVAADLRAGNNRNKVRSVGEEDRAEGRCTLVGSYVDCSLTPLGTPREGGGKSSFC